jgi:hypothetical protein
MPVGVSKWIRVSNEFVKRTTRRRRRMGIVEGSRRRARMAVVVFFFCKFPRRECERRWRRRDGVERRKII